jgi:hypothetical protein
VTDIGSESSSRAAEGASSATPPAAAQQHPSEGYLYRSTNEAAADGAAVVDGLASGVLATIDACVKTLEATAKFKENVEAITAFLNPLVEAKVLSPNEARLGLASPKLSRLCKIGKYADRLRHEEVVRYFLETGCSGHTLIYQFAVLLDETRTNQGEEEGIQQLVATLRREQIETRQGMLRLTRNMKDAKRSPSSIDPITAEPSRIEPEPGNEPRELNKPVDKDLGRGFDLIMATLQRSHSRKLRENWEGPLLPRCLWTHKIVAESAVLVVVATLSDLPTIENVLLPYCGFGGVTPRVLLPHLPTNPEVTDARIVVVAECGSGQRARFSEIAWLREDEPIDPFAIADRLAPDAKKRLNLFASTETEGWHSLTDEDNWGLTDA